VRRQAAITLRTMEAIVRVQALFRGRRVRMSKDGRALKSRISRIQRLTSRGNGVTYTHSTPSSRLQYLKYFEQIAPVPVHHCHSAIHPNSPSPKLRKSCFNLYHQFPTPKVLSECSLFRMQDEKNSRRWSLRRVKLNTKLTNAEGGRHIS